MSKEIQTKQANAVSTIVNEQDRVIASDIIVPYLSVGQGMSEAVMERKVQLGDMYRSTNLEVLGGPDKQIEVVFLHNPKPDWVIEQKAGSRFEFRRSEPRNASNENLEWKFFADKDGNPLPEGHPNATEWRRVKRLTVFAILPQDVAAYEAELKKVELGELPDPSKAITPICISFRSSSYKTGGKEVTSFFSQAKTMRVPIWRYTLKIGVKLEKNDEGTFYIWVVDRSKPTAVPKEILPMVEEWANMIGAANIQVHEEGETATYANSNVVEATAEAKGEVC